MSEREKADMWFLRLVPLLAAMKLPMENGPARFVSPDEFMYMGGNDVGAFKHRDSRNYVYVKLNGPESPNGGYRLEVPVSPNAFHRGFFDKFEVPEVP